MDVLAGLLGQAPSIAEIREQIRQIVARISQARRLPPILIEGETGTGKNLVAGTIHRAGPRAGRPFVDVNCAAIPEGLLEAELFGFERGAFTDARQAKAGLFEAARAGTILLDEIALLSDALQAKLLTVIDERGVRRLGSTRSEPVDVCIIAATNENLLGAVRARRFRQDLYHRLAVLTLRLPPLREHPDDVPILAEHFLERACLDYGLPRKVLAPAARDALCAYPWPGNVRELSNVMERVALLTETARILPGMLDLPIQAPSADLDLAAAVPLGTSLDARVETWERQELLRALEATGWKVARAAVRLGLTRGTIRYRIAKHGLEPPTRRGRTRRPRSDPGTPTSPPSAPSAPVVLRWEDRLVAVLQASARPVDADDPPAEFGRHFDVLVQKVESFGGRVEEAGTARLVAAFGLDPAEDAPRRAALAAMAIQNALGRDRETQAARTVITAAVHADQCPVAEIGGRRQVDADSKRRMVSVLDALAADARPDAVLVSEAARALLGSRFVVDDLSGAGNASRRGGRLRAYHQHRFGLSGDPGPFVGRERELAALESRWREAREGRGELVAAVGEPGIGKSRLVFEFARRRADERLIHLEGRGESYGTSVPYRPLVELLKSYLRVDERDDPLTTAEKVTCHLLALDPALAPDVTPILALLDAPVGDPEWQELEPPRRRQRTMDALKRLVLHASLSDPVLLVIEDLHWIDTETQAFLDRLVPSLPSARLLVLVSYRPEYRHAWGGTTGYTQLHLDPLPTGSAEELVRGLVGAAALQPLRHLLIERTEGNPFFLEESVRTLVETRVLVGERGAYHPTQAVDTLQVPPTVRAMLAVRIDRLTPEGKQVLEAGAVVGKDVQFVLLQAIASVPDATLRDAVAELQSAEFFREARLSPDVEYTFKHALTHEVAYGTVPADRRRSLHARMVETLEHLYGGRLTEQVERLAHHAQRAELWPKAVTYLRQAAAKAVVRYANREAVSCLEQALGAVPHLPESPETRAQAIDLRLDLQVPLLLIGEIERVHDELRVAETLAGELGDLYRMGRVAAYMTHVLILTGRSQAAVTGSERALAIARKVGDLGLEALASYRLGQAYRWLGEYTRAIAAFKWGIDTLVGDLPTQHFGVPGSIAVRSRVFMGWCLAELGEFHTAIAWVEEAVRMAEALDDRHGLAMAQSRVGLICVRQGDPARALPWLEQSLDGAQRFDFEPMLKVFVAGPLGEARAACGATGEAVAFLEQAAELATDISAVIHLPGILGALAEAYLLAGRRAEAQHAAERMLQLTRAAGQRHGEGEALRILGEIHARANPVEAGPAEESYRDALSIADQLGTRPLAARCHLDLGKLYRATGQEASAKNHLATAATMFGDMDMASWLEKARSNR